MKRCLFALFAGVCLLLIYGGRPFLVNSAPFERPESKATNDERDSDAKQVTLDDLEHIGGRWFREAGEPRRYYYKEGDRIIDLFSYHLRDSNKDGIDEIRVSHDSKYILIDSQGYPNHPTAIFPNSQNPNSIRVQKFQFRLPLEPQLAESITRLPMGPIGTALNGVVFFNPFEAEGMNAVEGYSEVWLDACCGHPQQSGVYHYHKYPSCVKSPFSDDGKQHSPIIGFAFDGFPIYGPYEEAAVMAKELKDDRALDVCNGHSDEVRGYHYHVTPGRFPYVIGGYKGVVEASNNRGLRRFGMGAIVDNTQPGSRLSQVIEAVKPGFAMRGQRQTIQFDLRPENSRRRLPEEKPSWIQIGPYEAIQIERQGNVVTAEFNIPDDATVGVFFDCHIEFGSGTYPLVVKKNDVLRIVDESSNSN